MIDSECQICLRKNSLFQEFTESEFSMLLDNVGCIEITAGKLLFSQNEQATDFFFIVNGKIKLSLVSIEGTEKIVDFKDSGATFAEAVILEGAKGYPVNATTLTDSKILRINADGFKNILCNSPKTCLKVISCLSQSLHELMGEINRLSLHNATYRLISYLLETVPEETSEAAEVNLSIAKHIVASRISVTPETLSRTLKRLSQQGLLKVRDNHVILLKPEELRHMVSI